MSLLTKSFPTKEWFHLPHVRKGFRQAFTGKARTLGFPCRLVYGYLVMRIKKRPRPTSKRQIAAAFGMNRARLNVILKLLQDRALVASVSGEWYAAQPSEEAMADWFVGKVKTEADTWHGRLAGVPVLLRSGKKGLSNLDAAVLSLAFNFCDQKVQKYRSPKALAHFLGSTPRTIRTSLRRLAKLGFVSLNADVSRVVQVTTAPTENQLAFFKDKKKARQPIAEALAEVVNVDRLLETIQIDTIPPCVKAKMKAGQRLRERQLSPVAVSILLQEFSPDVILEVDQREPGPLTKNEFAERCRAVTAPPTTAVRITEDRSDSIIPSELLANGSSDSWTERVPASLDSIASPIPQPQQVRRRGPGAPRLSPEDASDLRHLLTALGGKDAPDEPSGSMAWLGL
ncbi:MAG: helix-turn-helix domain-containing protein [Gemmataceae bacterium]|nr:helix-turn-helix domain-containing protein [Gemmataceae bacterium]